MYALAIVYDIIILSFRRKGGPSRYSPVLRTFCEPPPPPPTFPAARVAHDNHVVHALARVCMCPRSRGLGVTMPKLFSREKAYCVLKNRFYFVLNEFNSAL